jgi:hypothetical protein
METRCVNFALSVFVSLSATNKSLNKREKIGCTMHIVHLEEDFIIYLGSDQKRTPEGNKSKMVALPVMKRPA